MRRRVAIIILFLLFGVMVNVAVAWACAVAAHDGPNRTRAYYNPRGTDPLVIFVDERIGFESVSGCGRSGTFLARTPEDAHDYRRGAWWFHDALNTSDHNYALAAGWPCLCVTAMCTTTWDASKPEVDDGSEYVLTLHTGMLVRDDSLNWAFEPRQLVLPFRPLWPGFGLNTLFYAAILATIFLVPAYIRRTLRRRGGRCPTCAYPIGASPTCTECGSAACRRPAIQA
jgi:hypothetical protein